MVKLSKYYRRLIIVLVISNIAFATLFLTKLVGAGNVVSVIGAIEVYDSDGVSPLTSYDFPLFTGAVAETFLKYFFVNNTGNQPVYVYWNISTSSIAWEARTPNLDVYDYCEDSTWKYSFGIRQDFLTPTDYWHPDREAIFLGVSEGIKLRFELYYTGEPNTAETFTMTISFYATSEDSQDPVVMLEDLKTKINELPPEAFRYSRFVEWQKKRLCKQIDRVIKRVEYGNYEWAIWQLKWLKRRIGKQILDPYKATLIGKVDEIMSTLKSMT